MVCNVLPEGVVGIKAMVLMRAILTLPQNRPTPDGSRKVGTNLSCSCGCFRESPITSSNGRNGVGFCREQNLFYSPTKDIIGS
jgi:hypothetical protein